MIDKSNQVESDTLRQNNSVTFCNWDNIKYRYKVAGKNTARQNYLRSFICHICKFMAMFL